jgi:histone H3/H4
LSRENIKPSVAHKIRGKIKLKTSNINQLTIISINKIKWCEGSAIMAMQEAGETHLVGLFEDVNVLAINCKRLTILTRDLALARRIWNEPTIGGAV